MKKRQKVIITALLLCMTIIQFSCEKEEAEPEKVATALVLVSGDNQSVQIETTLSEAVIVMVKDQEGTAFGGVTVSFTVVEGSLSVPSVVTDNQGKAQVIWTLGATAGQQTLTAKAYKKGGTTALTGSPLTVKATATPAPPVATTLELISGNNQEAVIESLLANSVDVRIKDQYGEAMAGVVVAFSLTEGSLSSATVITDNQGKASVSWTLGSTIGNQVMIAKAFKADGTTPLVGSPIDISATGKPVPPAATSIELTDSGEQEEPVETELPKPIEVIVKDQYGMAIEGVIVKFSVVEGSVSAAQQVTDASGKANVTWILGPTVGQQTMTIKAFKADGTTPLAGSPISKFAYGIASNTVTDVDGNTYKSVVIGTQTWMAENLRTTKYDDGTEIHLIINDLEWTNHTDAAYTWYDNDKNSHFIPYGALYDWYAVNTGKLCPSGWHVPTQGDFQTLVNYLGGDQIAGFKLRETGVSHWAADNGATNESGFTAVPGGHRRLAVTQFLWLTYWGQYWLSTLQDANNAYSMAIGSNYATVVEGSAEKGEGRSIRCIKD